MITSGQIKELAVKHGFKLTNETGDDLKPYVYDFARDLIDASHDDGYLLGLKAGYSFGKSNTDKSEIAYNNAVHAREHNNTIQSQP